LDLNGLTAAPLCAADYMLDTTN